MNSHYYDMREVTDIDSKELFASPVKLSEGDRIRIYSTQLMEEVLLNITSHNYLYHISLYYKQGHRLLKRFPHREEDINMASVMLWERVQQKLKLLKQK